MTRRRAAAAWIALGAATLALIAARRWNILDAAGWRMAVIVVTGLALASAMLATIGAMLRREWLDLVEDELLPAGATLPVCLLLALPLIGISGPDGLEMTARREVWFTDWFVAFRLIAGLAGVFALVAALVGWRKRRRGISMVGLPLVATVFAVLLIDWDLVREPQWWTPIIPFVGISVHCMAALALTFIYHLAQREKGEDTEFASMAATLLSLALLAVWASVVQYLIGWYGNLPDAAAWYGARLAHGAGAATVLAAAGLTVISVLLLLWSRARQAMLAAAVLLLLAYLAQQVWWFSAFDAATLITFALVAAIWAGWLALFARHYDQHMQPGE